MSTNLNGDASSVSNPAYRKGAFFGYFGMLAILVLGAVLVALLLPAVQRGRETPRRSQCKNNLKQIGLALHNYRDEHGTFPPVYTVDSYGNPLHSWRALILPYLDQAPLYNSINLSKSWDDPENADARETSLAIFQCPSAVRAERNLTPYLAVATPNGCFPPARATRIADIADGPSQTLMVIEVPAEQSVPWMAPVDADESLVLGIGPESKLHHVGGVHAALADGSIRFLSAGLPIAKRRALISIAGGETVEDF